MYQQLAQLIRDGVWLKSYLAAVMRLQHEAYLVGHPSCAPLSRIEDQQQDKLMALHGPDQCLHLCSGKALFAWL